MRDFSIVVGCVIGMVLIVSLVTAFNNATKETTEALETSQLRAEVAAAESEARDARAEVVKLKRELKKALDNNQILSRRFSELQKQVVRRNSTPVVQAIQEKIEN